MSTTWFQKHAGSEVHEGIDDESMVLVGDTIPDWVGLPSQLGGARVRVLGWKASPCPLCKGGHDVRHLQVEDGLGVAECRTHGFVWYRGSV